MIHQFAKERLANIVFITSLIIYAIYELVWMHSFKMFFITILTLAILFMLLYAILPQFRSWFINFLLRPYYIVSIDYQINDKITNIEKFQMPDYTTIRTVIDDRRIASRISLRKECLNSYVIDYDDGKIVFKVNYNPQNREAIVTSNKFTVVDLEYEKVSNLVSKILQIIRQPLQTS